MSEILNILGSVGFNWHVALANFVNFLIILFLLNKFFFTKIGKTIDERTKTIEQGLHHASEAERKLAQAEEEKGLIIKSAHKEKEGIVSRAEILAQDVAATIEKEAQVTIDAKLLKLKRDEMSLRETVEKAFGEKAPGLVAVLYAKTLSVELTESENNALISRMQA